MSARQKAAGRHLALIHAMHLSDMDEVAGLLRTIEQHADLGRAAAEAARSLQMIEQYRLFGSLCGQECQILTAHHDIEEARIFPALKARACAEVGAVLDKLAAEHKVIHAALETLAERANAAIRSPGPETHAALTAIFEELHALVRSHFTYEETELADALGFHGVQV